MNNELTAKQAAFVMEYLIDLNATQAAIRAGYSPKTARQLAVQLLMIEKVQNAITRAMEARAKRLDRQAEQVVRDIYEIGKQAREQGQFGQALKALELEGKHLGMFRERVEVSGTDGAPIQHEMTVSAATEVFLQRLNGETT